VFRTLIAICAALTLAGSAAADTNAVYYRVFLTDGSSLASYGEFARVADRVVFSMPLGDSDDVPTLQLVSVPADRVDWSATEKYADAARAAHFAATRGEQEYAALNAEVAAALNDIARSDDPVMRLRRADLARRRLAEWSRASYGYRSRDVAELSSMLDEVAAGLRADAGGNGGFDLQLVAMVSPPPAVPLLPPPTLRESAEQGLAAATVATDAGERKALLAAVARALTGTNTDWAATLANRARRELELEETVDRSYRGLTQTAIRNAKTRAAAADVRGVQGIIAHVLAQDDELGRRRPAEVSALLATLDARLDAARRLRLARDRWALRVPRYRAYARSIAAARQVLAALRRPIDDIKELAGPSRRVLLRAQLNTSEAALMFSRVSPPDDLLPVHALFVSAVQLAATACKQRLAAVSTGDEQTAWAASSAAAGSQMLLDRAQKDLTRWLKPPSLP
jgi:hypothetical protein